MLYDYYVSYVIATVPLYQVDANLNCNILIMLHYACSDVLFNLVVNRDSGWFFLHEI